MTEAQRPRRGRAGRPDAMAVAPREADSRVVTAHAALAEPLITVEGFDGVLTPREAASLSERLMAACAVICHQRPDIAERDQLNAVIKLGEPS